jgi:phosphoribosylformylglycinamidine synthase
VRGTLTPQLDATLEDTTLVLIDLGHGRNRMGGSILGQVLGQTGRTPCPIWTIPKDLVNLVNAINALRARARSWPTTTAATAACWPPWRKWPLPAMWAWR